MINLWTKLIHLYFCMIKTYVLKPSQALPTLTLPLKGGDLGDSLVNRAIHNHICSHTSMRRNHVEGSRLSPKNERVACPCERMTSPLIGEDFLYYISVDTILIYAFLSNIGHFCIDLCSREEQHRGLSRP